MQDPARRKNAFLPKRVDCPSCKKIYLALVLYILTKFGCWALQSLVKTCFFIVCFFVLKSWKKQEICSEKQFFKVCTRTLVECFIPRKNVSIVKSKFSHTALFPFLFFWHEKHLKSIFWPPFWVQSTQALVAIYNPLERRF